MSAADKGHELARKVWAVEASLRVACAACSTNDRDARVLSNLEFALPLLADRLEEIGSDLADAKLQELCTPKPPPAPTKKARK